MVFKGLLNSLVILSQQQEQTEEENEPIRTSHKKVYYIQEQKRTSQKVYFSSIWELKSFLNTHISNKLNEGFKITISNIRKRNKRFMVTLNRVY